MFKQLLKLVLFCFGFGIAEGKIILGPGSPSKVFVCTGFLPTKVSLSFADQPSPPSCAGDIDAFDVIIVPRGFYIIAKVNGQPREIGWKAVGWY